MERVMLIEEGKVLKRRKELLEKRVMKPEGLSDRPEDQVTIARASERTARLLVGPLVPGAEVQRESSVLHRGVTPPQNASKLTMPGGVIVGGTVTRDETTLSRHCCLQ